MLLAAQIATDLAKTRFHAPLNLLGPRSRPPLLFCKAPLAILQLNNDVRTMREINKAPLSNGHESLQTAGVTEFARSCRIAWRDLLPADWLGAIAPHRWLPKLARRLLFSACAVRRGRHRGHDLRVLRYRDFVRCFERQPQPTVSSTLDITPRGLRQAGARDDAPPGPLVVRSGSRSRAHHPTTLLGLHEREGKALTNFQRTLPPEGSDMAEQILRSVQL
jgi:hypothetical protein